MNQYTVTVHRPSGNRERVAGSCARPSIEPVFHVVARAGCVQVSVRDVGLLTDGQRRRVFCYSVQVNGSVVAYDEGSCRELGDRTHTLITVAQQLLCSKLWRDRIATIEVWNPTTNLGECAGPGIVARSRAPRRHPRTDRERLEDAVERASDAFWQQIARAFPEARSGDIAPVAQINFETACREVTECWVSTNTRKERR